MSDSLSPPNGERAGVRGKHLKIKSLLTLTHYLITCLLIFSTGKLSLAGHFKSILNGGGLTSRAIAGRRREIQNRPARF